MLSKSAIEAIYQRDLVRADESYQSLLDAAEKERFRLLRENGHIASDMLDTDGNLEFWR